MTRENLISALSSAAEELGYTPSFAADAVHAAKTCNFPLLWVSPPAIVSASGNRDCRITYHIKAKLLMLKDSMQSNLEEAWRVLECDAIDFFHSISEDNRVETVANFKCRPTVESQTPQGDVSVATEFDVEMFYCI